MTSPVGTFVWFELLTSDGPAAQSFYQSVIGWEFMDSGMKDRSYSIFSKGATMVGGMMPITKEMAAGGARPLWMGYIAVDDVDAVAARVAATGGHVLRPGEDIPGIGRFAVVTDPQAAPFVLFKGTPPPHPLPVVKPGTPGHIGWHEYDAAGPATFAYFSALFGWTKGETMDMGPIGTYQIFNINGVMAGGMASANAESRIPLWRYYINVADIDAAVARITAAGGRILLPPHAVPGGSWIIHGLDPQGAFFALAGPRL